MIEKNINLIPSHISEEMNKLLLYMKSAEKEPTLLVLKAHLLAEESLYSFIERLAFRPKMVSDARLTFAQLLALARAFHVYSADDWWCWSALQKLNSLRNHLAHNFTPANLDKRIIEFAQFVVDSMTKGKPEFERQLEIEFSLHAKNGIHPFLLALLATQITLSTALTYEPQIGKNVSL